MKKYTLWLWPDDNFNNHNRWRDHETGAWADDMKDNRFWVPAYVAEMAEEKASKLENAIRRFENGERVDFQAILDGLEQA